MAGNDVAKIFDLEGPFEARGKEATKWSDDAVKYTNNTYLILGTIKVYSHHISSSLHTWQKST